ncbi:MAG: glycosyltransferase family 4 protein [Hyphomicrobiales bacterium]
MSGKIAFVLKGYPRLSETFIAQEILGLEKSGLDIEIVSLRHPYDPATHPVHAEIKAPVHYLPEYLHKEPQRVLRALSRAHKLPGFKKAVSVWASDLSNDRSRNRIRRFGQAMVLATELGDEISRLHAHFIHTPASVTAYAALMLDVPWTCSAHAKDIWTSPDWELAGKLNDMGWVSVCTRYGAEHLASLTPFPEKVKLIYHGLDLERFPSPDAAGSERDGGDGDDPVRLLTVGRAVEKKGLDNLLNALAQLPDSVHWRWGHVGGGELLETLKAQAEELNLSTKITWYGAISQQQVIALYRESDMFVLPCRVAKDGDRDGLPNVLVEAQSQRLPCISTPVSGVTELLEDEVNGLLVTPDKPGELAVSITKLIENSPLRQRLGSAGEHIVRSKFSHEQGLKQLKALFDGDADMLKSTQVVQLKASD